MTGRLTIALALVCSFGCNSLLSELERLKKKAKAGDAPIAAGAGCTPEFSTVKPYFSSSPNWLDYVRRDSSDATQASGTPCDGSEGGHYGSCIHAGEMRTATLSCVTSCTGLAVRDDLDAFTWRCDTLTGGGGVRFVSVGLKAESGLSQLIDFANGSWRQMQLRVDTASESYSSTPAVWWNNPIVLDPSAAMGALANSGTIYAFSSNPASGYTIGADAIAVVGSPNVKLSHSGAIFTATGRKFLWVEGMFRLTTNSSRIAVLDNVRFSVFRNIGVHGVKADSPTYAIAFTLANGSNANLFAQVAAAGYGDGVINTSNSAFNTGYRLLKNNSYRGLVDFANNPGINWILIDFVSNQHIYSGIFMLPNNHGLYVQNAVLAHTSSSTDGALAARSRATVIGVVFGGHLSTTQAALDLLAVLPGSTVADVAIMHNAFGLGATIANMYNYFTGRLIIGNNTINCSGATNSGISSSCAPTNASDFTLENTATLTNSFVGRVYTNDPVNASTAVSGLSTGLPADWLSFSHRYRMWGKDAGDFGTAGNAGWCNGSCRLWDYALRTSDTVLRNRLSLPGSNDYRYHRWDASTQATCEAIKGAVWQDTVCSRPGYMTAGACTAAGGTWSTNLCTTKYLKNAQEILFDGIGNENGICESDEACLYTPNIGAYQGHGRLNFVSRISGSGINNVDLYQYEFNGY